MVSLTALHFIPLHHEGHIVGIAEKLLSYLSFDLAN